MSESPVRVYFPSDPRQSHYVYRVGYQNPPSGIEFLTDGQGQSGLFSRASDIAKKGIKSVGINFESAYHRYWRGQDVSKFTKDTPDYDLYHNRGTARRRREFWVQGCEHIGNPLGTNWREKLDELDEVQRVSDAFASPECKAIIPETKAGAESIRQTIPNSDEFEEKIESVPLAYDPPEEASPPEDGIVKFLFVGSSHFDDQFYIKGGDKVLRAYDQIRDEVDAQLTVRGDVPEKYVERYSKYDDIDLVTDIIPRDELESLYRESDIFVFPSAQGTPGAVFREAMGHALAIIGLDIWGNQELVATGESGFLIEPDESFQYVYPEYNVPVVGTGNYFRRRGSRSMEDIVADLTSDDEALVERVAEKMRLLAEDSDMRHRMAMSGRKSITEGDLSLAARNEELGRILREAAAAE